MSLLQAILIGCVAALTQLEGCLLYTSFLYVLRAGCISEAGYHRPGNTGRCVWNVASALYQGKEDGRECLRNRK